MTLHANLNDVVLDLTGHPVTVTDAKYIDHQGPHESPGSELVQATVVLAETSSGVASEEIVVRGTRDHLRAMADGLSAAADVEVPLDDPAQ